MVTRRSRELRADPGDVFALATDPNHLPRWWPATQRVERVSASGWTSVFETPRGRTVRADFVVQAPRGWARLRRLQLRRAGVRRLDQALAGLAGLLEEPR